ncbi:hypothetical protein FQN55_002405 [Onygenales sp. PD_40]|nr:hypothetical protein FQN55_002405 [Onygenales sp. PD_40]
MTSSIPAFPFLTPDEFASACQSLLAKSDAFRGDLTSLGWTSVRLEKKLTKRIFWALSSQHDELVLIINRNLEDKTTISPQVHEHVASDTLSSKEGEDDDMAEIGLDDDDDPEELVRQPCHNPMHQVEYNILLSPTYQVPILYFFLHNLSAKGREGLDVVYNRLVPAQYRSELKDVGVMGGLSIGVRITSAPFVFSLKCLTNGCSITPYRGFRSISSTLATPQKQ